MTLLNNNGGPKIREGDAQIKMSTTFKDKNEDSDYSLRLVFIERDQDVVFVRVRTPKENNSQQGVRERIHRSQSINRSVG